MLGFTAMTETSICELPQAVVISLPIDVWLLKAGAVASTGLAGRAVHGNGSVQVVQVTNP